MPFKPFTDYLLLEKKYSSHTVAAYTKDIERFFDFVSKEYDLKSLLTVNYSMVRSWIVYLVDTGISNSSINRKISSLKTYYKFLLKTSQISQTPLAKHRALKVAKKVQIPFSQTEVEDVFELFDHANDFETLRDKLMVELFYSTGIRRAELIGLRLSDVSEVQKTIKVLGKRNKERIIPLLPSVLATIAKYKIFREALVNNHCRPKHLKQTIAQQASMQSDWIGSDHNRHGHNTNNEVKTTTQELGSEHRIETKRNESKQNEK